jgi:hypothetical protein
VPLWDIFEGLAYTVITQADCIPGKNSKANSWFILVVPEEKFHSWVKAWAYKELFFAKHCSWPWFPTIVHEIY